MALGALVGKVTVLPALEALDLVQVLVAPPLPSSAFPFVPVVSPSVVAPAAPVSARPSAAHAAVARAEVEESGAALQLGLAELGGHLGAVRNLDKIQRKKGCRTSSPQKLL